MRRLLILCVILLSACASSGSSSTPSARPATSTIGGANVGSITMTNSTTADVTHLANTPDAVFRILPSVFDSVGILVNTIDPARKQVGNSGFKIRARLGKAPLSRYLDCGNTQIGPNADSYDVMLTVMTTVSPEGPTGAVLSTTVDAQAKPVTYNQSYSHCSSKGGIEIRISDLVKARLAR